MATKKKKTRSRASKKRASKPSGSKHKAARKPRPKTASKKKAVSCQGEEGGLSQDEGRRPSQLMKAAAIDKTGPPEVLTIHTVPVPKMGPKDVLISLLAAGVGIWDAQIRKGDYSVGSKRFPRVLGSDGAGIVADVGRDVRRFKEGDRVWAYDWESSKTGFYAEYVAPNEKNVAHAPDELTLIEAGAAAVTGMTALQGVDDHLKLDKSETILVFGATGAVGTLAVQFAKRTGAHVVATASPGRADTTLHEIGIEQVFDSRAANASERLRSFAPGGLTAVLAFAGGDDLERCIDQLVPGRSRLVSERDRARATQTTERPNDPLRRCRRTSLVRATEPRRDRGAAQSRHREGLQARAGSRRRTPASSRGTSSAGSCYRSDDNCPANWLTARRGPPERACRRAD